MEQMYVPNTDNKTASVHHVTACRQGTAPDQSPFTNLRANPLEYHYA